MITSARTHAPLPTIPVLRVRDLMSVEIPSVELHSPVETIREIMRDHRLRHLPVVGPTGDLLGLVSQRDVCAAARPEADRELVPAVEAGDVMTTPVDAVGPDAEIRKAAQIMLEHKYGCLPVVEDGRVVGVLTEADFVRLLGRV